MKSFIQKIFLASYFITHIGNATPSPSSDETLTLTISIQPYQFLSLGTPYMVLYPELTEIDGHKILKGRANNSLYTIANTKIQLQVSVLDSSLTKKDQLTMTLVPTNSGGKGSTIYLWDGIATAYQTQIASGIDKDGMVHSFFIDYEGELRDKPEDIDVKIMITAFAE